MCFYSSSWFLSTLRGQQTTWNHTSILKITISINLTDFVVVVVKSAFNLSKTFTLRFVPRDFPTSVIDSNFFLS